MKKLLLSLSLAFIATTFVNAQDYVWNFANDSENFPVGSGYATETTVLGLTINPGSATNMGVIEKSTKVFEDVEYTNRFKFNGGGYNKAAATDMEPTTMMPAQRFLSFSVDGPCSITALGITGSNSSERRVFLTDGESLVGTIVFPVTEGALSKETVEYKGEATTLYMFCNAACNLYTLEVTGDKPSSINQNDVNKTVTSVAYFDLLGRKATEATQGALIKKVIYDDASVETTKVYVQ